MLRYVAMVVSVSSMLDDLVTWNQHRIERGFVICHGLVACYGSWFEADLTVLVSVEKGAPNHWFIGLVWCCVILLVGLDGFRGWIGWVGLDLLLDVS